MFGWSLTKPAAPRDADPDDLAILPDNARVVMVFALEMQGDGLGEAADTLARRLPRDTLVFVHTALDFRPLMTRKLAWEVVPSVAEMRRFPGLVHWPRYLEDRRALLVAKWRPARAIAYGPTLEAYAKAAPDRNADA